jgi:ATP-dependent Lhr-like helicase
VDWQRRVAYVNATEMQGRSHWKGERPGLAFRLCQSIKQRLAGDDDCAMWSTRARQQLAAIRQEFVWLDTEGTVVLLDKHGRAEWWTFAGARANAMLASALSQGRPHRATYDSFTVTCEAGASRNTLTLALNKLRASEVQAMSVAVEERALEGLKFSACLPRDLALDMLRTRLGDPPAVQAILEQPVHYVSV